MISLVITVICVYVVGALITLSICACITLLKDLDNREEEITKFCSADDTVSEFDSKYHLNRIVNREPDYYFYLKRDPVIVVFWPVIFVIGVVCAIVYGVWFLIKLPVIKLADILVYPAKRLYNRFKVKHLPPREPVLQSGPQAYRSVEKHGLHRGGSIF